MNASATLYADLDQLLAWYAGAQPGGAWVRWAAGPAIDWNHATARQVAEWREAGCVEEPAEDKRRPGEWLVRRAFQLAADGTRRGVVPEVALEPRGTPVMGKAAQLLAHLRERQASGSPRPSYREMAEAVGLRNREAARHLFRKLETRGLIDTG